MALQCYTRFLKKLESLTSSSSCGLDEGSDDRPLILRHYSRSDYLRISITDANSITKECSLKLSERPSFVSCCNGLALFTLSTPSRHIVFNPLQNDIEITTINAPYRGGQVCGFFFHPLAKEYRILSAQRQIEDIGSGYDYHLYSFESQIWRKIETLRCQPPYRNIPAIVNNALHWCMVDANGDEKWIRNHIMVFDVITEEFSWKLLPIERTKCRKPNLVVRDDHLCLFYVSCEEPVMDIWILEDYEKWSWEKFSWVKKYVVNLDWDMNKYPIEKSYDTLWDIMDDIKVISIHDNELVLFWKHRGMFSCNLELNIVEKINLRVSLLDKLIYNDYDGLSDFEAYSATQM